MNDTEKLKAVLEKAIKGGWRPEDFEGMSEDKFAFSISKEVNRVVWSFVLFSGKEKSTSESSVYGVLFSHDFAKAFFDAGFFCCSICEDRYNISLWQYHLQQAVLSEHPLDYYYNHLNS